MGTPIAQQAINTYLKLGTAASPPVYTAGTIANVGDYTGPSMKKTMADVTSHSSNVPWIQRLGTILDGGDVKLPMFFVPGDSNMQALLAVFTTVGFAGIRWYELDFTDGTTWHFQATISDWQVKAPVKGVYTADVTFSITGSVSFT